MKSKQELDNIVLEIQTNGELYLQYSKYINDDYAAYYKLKQLAKLLDNK